MCFVVGLRAGVPCLAGLCEPHVMSGRCSTAGIFALRLPIAYNTPLFKPTPRAVSAEGPRGLVAYRRFGLQRQKAAVARWWSRFGPVVKRKDRWLLPSGATI